MVAIPIQTLTQGKDAKLAKQIELEGWDYPRHLAGRLFSVVVHGDVEGVENVRRSISDWLRFMQLSPAGPLAEVDRYIGYWKPYATNHEELDADTAIQDEVRNAAQTLLEAVLAQRDGQFVAAEKICSNPARNKRRDVQPTILVAGPRSFAVATIVGKYDVQSWPGREVRPDYAPQRFAGKSIDHELRLVSIF